MFLNKVILRSEYTFVKLDWQNFHVIGTHYDISELIKLTSPLLPCFVASQGLSCDDVVSNRSAKLC